MGHPLVLTEREAKTLAGLLIALKSWGPRTKDSGSPYGGSEICIQNL